MFLSYHQTAMAFHIMTCNIYMSIKNHSYFIHYYQDGPPPAIDKSGYYTGSVTSGVVNPAFSNKSMYKKKQNLDNISDTSLFEEDNVDDEFYLWDKNQDSGLVSAVSKSDKRLIYCYCIYPKE